MGKFIITSRTNGEFQFNLQAVNGETILTSEGYVTIASCIDGIRSVKNHSQDASMYEKLTASNGKLYFTLKADNGQIIGTSQMYADEHGRNIGIGSVKQNAPNALIVEH